MEQSINGDDEKSMMTVDPVLLHSIRDRNAQFSLPSRD